MPLCNEPTKLLQDGVHGVAKENVRPHHSGYKALGTIGEIVNGHLIDQVFHGSSVGGGIDRKEPDTVESAETGQTKSHTHES